MSTRDEILAAAVAEIRENDKAAFRVTRVAKNAGCATSVLYHYFGSREGLIDAALVAIAVEETAVFREFANHTADIAESTTDAVRLLVDYAALAHSAEHRRTRSLRARLIGAAQTRPQVREALRELGEITVIANEEMLRRLGEKGLIRTDINVKAVALCFRALDFGWVLDDLNDESRVPFDDWLVLMRELALLLATPTE